MTTYLQNRCCSPTQSWKGVSNRIDERIAKEYLKKGHNLFLLDTNFGSSHDRHTAAHINHQNKASANTASSSSVIDGTHTQTSKLDLCLIKMGVKLLQT